jgi:hypothetical protein
MGASAYLVVWRDMAARGRIVDAGIFSEPSPTTALASSRQPQCVMSVDSRYSAGHGGFGRARARLVEILALSPEWSWVLGMPTYRRMQRAAAPMRMHRVYCGAAA